MYRVNFLLDIDILRIENSEQLSKERRIGLKVLKDIDLVEEYEGIEHGEGWVIEDPRENDIFQIL